MPSFSDASTIALEKDRMIWKNSNANQSFEWGYGNSNAFTANFVIRSQNNPWSPDYFQPKVGVRNNDPAYTLDVLGRARLRWIEFAPSVGIVFHEAVKLSDYEPLEYSEPFQVSMINNSALSFRPVFNYNAFGIQTETGAIILNGSFGSNNLFAAAQTDNVSVWKGISLSRYYNQAQSGAQTSTIAVTDANPQATLNDLTRTFTLAESGRVHVDFNVVVQAPGCAFCGNTRFEIWLVLDGVLERYFGYYLQNGRTINADGNSYLGLKTNPFTTAISYNNISAGTHTLSIQVRKTEGPPINVIASGTMGSTLHVDAYTRNQ